MVSLRGNVSVYEAERLVKHAIDRLGTSVEVAGEVKRSSDAGALRVIVVQKYFLRIGSFASLTIVLTGDDRTSTVEAIASGAGEGILNIDWNATGSFERDFAAALRDVGYPDGA